MQDMIMGNMEIALLTVKVANASDKTTWDSSGVSNRVRGELTPKIRLVILGTLHKLDVAKEGARFVNV